MDLKGKRAALDRAMGQIEKTYGKPIAHWMGVLEKAQGLKHMEQVELLKTKHELGHGHANALVAAFRAGK